MKYLIACLFALGVFTASQAQTDSVKKDAPCLTCFYIDENTFQCETIDESEGVTKGKLKHEEDMSKQDPSLRQDDALTPEDQSDIESEDDVFNDPNVREDEYNQGDQGTESNDGVLQEDNTGTQQDAAPIESDPSMDEQNQNFMY